MQKKNLRKDVINDILAEAYGFDNVPDLFTRKAEVLSRYRALKDKKVLTGYEHRELMRLKKELDSGKYDMSVDPNEPVRPEWMDENGLSPDKFNAETRKKWNHYYPHDEEVAQQVADDEAYERMKRIKANGGIDPDRERHMKKSLQELLRDLDGE